MSNKKEGNAFEKELCDILYGRGFWVMNITQNQAGQPADIIAVRNREAYLIDSKVCENDRFPFSRIESNQHTAMTLWKQSGNGDGVFALKMSDSKIYMIDYHMMTALSLKQASIGIDLIERYGKPLREWVKHCR